MLRYDFGVYGKLFLLQYAFFSLLTVLVIKNYGGYGGVFYPKNK